MWQSRISGRYKAMFAWGLRKRSNPTSGKQHCIALHGTTWEGNTGMDIWHTSVIALGSSNIWVGGRRRVGHVGSRHGSGLELRPSVVAHVAWLEVVGGMTSTERAGARQTMSVALLVVSRVSGLGSLCASSERRVAPWRVGWSDVLL